MKSYIFIDFESAPFLIFKTKKIKKISPFFSTCALYYSEIDVTYNDDVDSAIKINAISWRVVYDFLRKELVMKYRFTAFTILFILLLAGCTVRKDYEVLTVSGYDADDTILLKDNVFLEDVDYMTYTDESVEKNKQFVFLGKEYSLTYMESMRKDFTSYCENMFVTIDGETFYFNKDTGALTMFASLNGIHQNILESPKNEDDFKEIAESILSEYINPDDYAYSCKTSNPVREIVDGETEGYIDSSDKFVEASGGNPTYYMVYTRMCGDLPTSESAVVALNKSGDIVALLLNSIDCFKEDESISIDMAALDEAIEKKAMSLIDESLEGRYEIMSKMLCKKGETPYVVVSVNYFVKDKGDVEYKVPHIFAVLLN